MQASDLPPETGGERPQKRLSKFEPFRAPELKAPTIDFSLSLKYPFSEDRRLE
jgi:hypothetical protein